MKPYRPGPGITLCLPIWLALCLLLPAHVVSAALPAPVLPAPARLMFTPFGDQRSLSVSPSTSTVGTPRTIFANGCTGPAILDESGASAGRLVVRIYPSIFECGQPPKIISYTPRATGKLMVTMVLPDGSIEFQTEMETVAAAHSGVNIDGMWYDPDTNGSGISFHHAATSDAVFGTWFLFATQPAGASRWFSLQSMRWTAGGSLLVGTAYEVTAENLPPNAAGSDRPRPATASTPVGSVGVTVLDANNLRVEAIDHLGRSAFISFLKRLQF